MAMKLGHQKNKANPELTATELKFSSKTLKIHAVSPQKFSEHFERSLNTSRFFYKSETITTNGYNVSVEWTY